MPPKLDIVIINWNAGDQLRKCLESVALADKDEFCLQRLVIVDNNSSDDSLDGIENYNLPITIIHNDDNRGFGAACNQGARGSASDFILFLNPDALLSENSLSGSVAFMQHPDNANIGILGIQLIDDAGTACRTCARFPTTSMFCSKILGLDKIAPHLFPSYVMDEWDHGINRYVDHVIGAFFLVRRQLFESLGGFDEKFFVYLEDLDFSLRAHNAGWSSFFLADFRAFHKGGGVSEQVKAKRLCYSLQSRLVYCNKHLGRLNSALVALGTLMVEPWIRLLYALLKLNIEQCKETVDGYVMLWSSLPKMLSPKRNTDAS